MYFLAFDINRTYSISSYFVTQEMGKISLTCKLISGNYLFATFIKLLTKLSLAYSQNLHLFRKKSFKNLHFFLLEYLYAAINILTISFFFFCAFCHQSSHKVFDFKPEEALKTNFDI